MCTQSVQNSGRYKYDSDVLLIITVDLFPSRAKYKFWICTYCNLAGHHKL